MLIACLNRHTMRSNERLLPPHGGCQDNDATPSVIGGREQVHGRNSINCRSPRTVDMALDRALLLPAHGGSMRGSRRCNPSWRPALTRSSIPLERGPAIDWKQSSSLPFYNARIRVRRAQRWEIFFAGADARALVEHSDLRARMATLGVALGRLAGATSPLERRGRRQRALARARARLQPGRRWRASMAFCCGNPALHSAMGLGLGCLQPQRSIT
jgi:hypothetical protein